MADINFNQMVLEKRAVMVDIIFDTLKLEKRVAHSNFNTMLLENRVVWYISPAKLYC
jgi:hypothetical protein